MRRAESPVPAVDAQCAVGNDRHWIGAEPPVDEIEVVRRLVHQEAAAARLEAVPTPEVVGAVIHVEVPAEIDRNHAADLAAEQQLLDLLVLRRIPQVECHDDLSTVPLFRVEHGLTLRLVDHHGLLGDHVDPAIERVHDIAAVEGVDGRDDDHIRLDAVAHLVEARERGTLDAHDRLRRADTLRIDVAQPRELDDITVALNEIAAPHEAGALSGPDKHIPAPDGPGRNRRSAKPEERRGGNDLSGLSHELTTRDRLFTHESPAMTRPGFSAVEESVRASASRPA